MEPSERSVTDLLLAWSKGEQDALHDLMPKVYGELRQLAQHYFRTERSDHTLQSTVLVHETFLRLIDQHRVKWQGRAHFFGIASQLMRRILVDHARSQRAAKRGGGRKMVLEEGLGFTSEKHVDLIALDQALEELSRMDSQQSRLVELRFFGGLTIKETAEVMGTSPATVKREWSMAKAWLYGRISGFDPSVNQNG